MIWPVSLVKEEDWYDMAAQKPAAFNAKSSKFENQLKKFYLMKFHSSNLALAGVIQRLLGL